MTTGGRVHTGRTDLRGPMGSAGHHELRQVRKHQRETSRRIKGKELCAHAGGQAEGTAWKTRRHPQED